MQGNQKDLSLIRWSFYTVFGIHKCNITQSYVRDEGVGHKYEIVCHAQKRSQ